MGANVHRVYTGFTFDRIGKFSFSVTDDGNGGSGTAAVLTGSFYHDLDTTGRSNAIPHTSFASKLETELESATSATWSVTYDNATMKYTVDQTTNTNNVSATLNTVAQNVLGMSSSLSGANSYTSTTRPFYVLPTAEGAISNEEIRRWTEDQIERVRTDSGKQIGLGPTTFVYIAEWEHQYEPQARVLDLTEGSPEDWTWEELYEHVGGHEELALVNTDTTSSLAIASHVAMRFQVRGFFDPEMSFTNVDSHMHVPMQVVVLEELRR